ncbi:hypothetical protein pETSU_090 [Edwardsiella phage pEt-SU]|uniref:Uncharacterized protein n=1 Tax=Edwardsiella phage pEt-SU TaxID=2562142 RepID=A0A4D6DWD4_9CAUD|nr:hypothetical protein HOV39_gp090 [Edwardsiella phage pEt-SU]QBZ70671.1 hypothetical protein pETSU_090 [Edwardsiella phage pEt-SU]
MQQQITCLVDGNFVLSPAAGVINAPNAVIALVTKSTGPDGSITGILSWAGAVRAFLTYDMTGNRILSYTMADGTQQANQSVENILRAM